MLPDFLFGLAASSVGPFHNALRRVGDLFTRVLGGRIPERSHGPGPLP
jgi:hypothetical protein